MALIAESIRRAVGVTVNDVHLGVGLAMCDQLRQVHPRRTAKTIKTLNKYLPTRRDRSLAAAFPAIYISSFTDLNVCVMVGHETYAREDAELYRAILEELDTPTEVIVNDEDRLPRVPAGEERATITVATPEVLARVEGHKAVIIARLSPELTKRVGRGLPGTAMLPDL